MVCMIPDLHVLSCEKHVGMRLCLGLETKPRAFKDQLSAPARVLTVPLQMHQLMATCRRQYPWKGFCGQVGRCCMMLGMLTTNPSQALTPAHTLPLPIPSPHPPYALDECPTCDMVCACLCIYILS